jgi:2-oxoglutarate ferredoxin oxidoreductase subunit alpha
VPTRSSQSDLRFAIHAGHGEFPRIVLAPGDPEETFKAGADALNLAWKFQVPVIVLLDKILSEHMMSLPAAEIAGALQASPESPMVFPGTPNVVVKITSYEHDQEGFTIDKPEDIKRMVEKRFEKMAKIEEEMKNREAIKIYGDAENVIVFFGSTKGAVLEASKYLNKPTKLMQIIWLEPFDTDKVKKELENKRIICVEGNHNGQLASLIREKTGIEIKNKILKYDSSPFDPLQLAEQINSMLS